MGISLTNFNVYSIIILEDSGHWADALSSLFFKKRKHFCARGFCFKDECFI